MKKNADLKFDLQGFLKENPSLDLVKDDLTKVTLKAGKKGSVDKETILPLLKSYQRVLRIHPDEKVASRMIDKGVDSAMQMTRMSRAEFIDQHNDAFDGDTSKAATAYDRAYATRNQVMLHWAAVKDGIASPYYQRTRFNTTGADTSAAYKDIPGYQDLFGRLEYCSTRSCQTLYSPGAYMVELLQLIEKHITNNPISKIPPALLFNTRRPDIESVLKLNCANTEDEVPYLSIVNDIMQTRVQPVGATGEEWLSEAKYPFNLPYHQPLKEIGLYLQQSKTSFASIYSIMNAAEADVTRSTLNISPQQLKIFTTVDITKASLSEFFGIPVLDNYSTTLTGTISAATGSAVLTGTGTLFSTELAPGFLINLKGTGITRTVKSIESDTSLTVTTIVDKDIISVSGYGYNNTQLGLVTTFTKQTGLTREQLYSLIYQGLSTEEIGKDLQALFFINSGDATFPSLAMTTNEISTENVEEVILNLSYTKLDAINRFVRLATALNWSFADLDWVLKSFKLSTLDITSFDELANVFTIQQSTKLSIPVICSFWYDMKSIGKGSDAVAQDLFDQVFNNPVIIASGSPVLYPGNPDNLTWDINGTDEENRLLRNRMLSSLGVSDLDLTAIAKQVSDKSGKISLDLANLSKLFRLSKMSSVFGMTARELVILLDLAGIKVPETVANFQLLAGWSAFIRKTSFTPDVLNYIIKDVPSSYLPVYFTTDATIALITDCQAIINSGTLDTTSFILPDINMTQSATAFNLLVQNKYLNNAGILLSAYSPIAPLDFLFKGEPNAVAMREEVRTELNTTLDLQQTINQTLLQKLAVFFGSQSAIMQPLVSFSEKVFDLYALIDLTISYAPGDKVPEDITTFLQFLNRNILFIRKLNLTDVEVKDIVSSPEHYNIADLLKIDIDDLQNIVEFVRLSAAFKDTDDRLIQFFNMPETSSVDKIRLLSDITHWDRDQITKLIEYFWPSDTTTYATVTGLAKLKSVFDQADLLGVNIQFLLNATTTTDLSWKYYSDLSKSMLDMFVAKNAGPQFSAVMDPLTEKLIAAKRNALLPYTIWYLRTNVPDIGMENMTDLYNYLLVDPEMGGCASISKIRLASLSIQLYVQRCHQGLELGAEMDAEFRKWWAWAGQYRTWEANRKVFLYPENYLEPELRQNKTAQFDALESSLEQSDLSADSITSIFQAYLDSFADLANIVIAGNFTNEISATEKILYLFGRSNTAPYNYYYTTCNMTFVSATEPWKVAWGSWEKIDLVIKSGYVTPVFAMDKLYLFWVETRKGESATITGGTQGPSTTNFYADIKYSYCNFNQQWIVPQAFGETIEVNNIQKDAMQQAYWQKVYIIYNTKAPSVATQSPMLDENTDAPAFFVTYGNYDFHSGTYDSTLRGTLLWADGRSEDWFFVFKGLNDYYNGNVAPVPGTFSKLQVISATNIIFDNDFGDAKDYIDSSKVHPNPPVPIETLLETVSVRNATVQTAKNQPGWIIFNNGDECLLFSEQAYRPTIAEGLEYDYATADKLEIKCDGYDTKGIVPTFSVERISTSVGMALSSRLLKGGISNLLTIDSQSEKELLFSRLHPNATAIINTPAETLNFDGSFGDYFKEIFFYIPFLIAQRLSTNKKYKDAQTWYQYIFNPTAEGDPNDPNRFWNYLPFRSNNTPETFSSMLQNPKAIKAYLDDPFDPFAIAELRTNAFQKAIVIKYINNLIEWGDQLFTQDSWESINEATMIYKLAEDILGPRPVFTRDCSDQPSKTYDEIETYYKNLGQDIPVFLIELEHQVTQFSRILRVDKQMNDDYNWYFHVPENAQFMECWTKVEDRLFKIRHCMNIAGVTRTLSLFGNPIDVMSLVRAAANNRDISSVVASLSNAVPLYRFTYMIEMARNYVALVSQLGNSLQGAIEQRDGEQLQMIRLQQETALLELSEQMKVDQVNMSEENLAGLNAALTAAKYRFDRYGSLLAKGNLPNESLQIESLEKAKTWNIVGGSLSMASSAAFSIPQIGSPFAITFGGQQIGGTLREAGSVFSLLSVLETFNNSLSFTKALFERRDEDWTMQQQLAQNDVEQIESQIRSARIMIELNNRDIEVSNKNIAQNQEIENFLRQKFAGADLYQWLIRQISGVYFQTYQLAVDLCRSAEKAFQFELDTQQTFIGSSHWDSLRQGLTSGERLSFDLQRMQQNYIINNSRRLEIQKSISLLQFDPNALLDLVNTGMCEFNLTELLFDYDFPGHYCRKISGISISIPAVVGPYQNVKATLTQLSNKTLLQADLKGVKYLLGVEADAPDDSVLRTDWRSQQQIALSTGLNDNGMFQLNFNDDRYLPFEGTGAISRWRLTMLKAANRFDFSTISDIIINLQYTAYPGGESFQGEVTALGPLKTFNSCLLMNLGIEYAGDWYAFMHPLTGNTKQLLPFNMSARNFPVNLASYSINSIMLQVTFNEDLWDSTTGGWDLGGMLTLKLKVYKQASELSFGFSDKNYAAQTVSIADFFGGWEIGVDKTDIPSKLKDPVTGMLDTKQFLGVTVVLQYQAGMNWEN